MELILHIGTHKTATTSLQHFFTLNRDVLRKNGIHYPSNKTSAYVANFLASDLAFGKSEKVLTYLIKAKNEAQNLGCRSVLVSAESFYAMTAFFLGMYDRQRDVADYWDNEEKLIFELRKHCTIFNHIRIVCYIRPQDEFASSVYNQMVKSTIGTSLYYLDFLRKIKESFDYRHHLSLWSKHFGENAIFITQFNEVRGNILKHFCLRFLTPDCYQQANQTDFLANTRLNRDVLEVKRAFNATEPDRAYAFVAAAVFRKLSDDYRDSKGYQVFASQADQYAFFSEFEEGNRALSVIAGFSEPLPVVTQGEPGYPGLETGTGLEIMFRFLSEMRTPWRRLVITMRRFARFIKEHFPGGKWIVLPMQITIHRTRLKLMNW